MISKTKFIFQFKRSLTKLDNIFAGNVFHEKRTPKKKKQKKQPLNMAKLKPTQSCQEP